MVMSEVFEHRGDLMSGYDLFTFFSHWHHRPSQMPSNEPVPAAHLTAFGKGMLYTLFVLTLCHIPIRQFLALLQA